MGVVIPQVVTSDSASGAQVIDGSLKFDRTIGTYLEKTFSSSGNRTTWTWSGWVKKLENNTSQDQTLFGGYGASNNTDWLEFGFGGSSDHTPADKLYWTTNGTTSGSSALLRDNSGWMNIVFSYDGSEFNVWKNGELIHTNSTSGNYGINGNWVHRIGKSPNGDQRKGSHNISQVYFIDGQALQPTEFGFTDPLTNTWKPKKYTGTFTGTNTFYLPLDGNSPIGRDQSGNGNDWTPVNIGGSVGLDKATGAKPILNTTQGGTQSGVSVFGSRQNVGYAVTVYDDGGGNKYYIDGVKQATLTGLIRGATYTFDTSDSTVSSHPFRFSTTTQEGGGSATLYSNGVAAITGTATTITIPYNAPNTLYYYCTSHSGMGADITGITTNEKLADQYASHCVLALPLVGVSNDVSVSVACTSTAKAITSNGTVAASNIESNIYSGSFLFDGDSDYFTFAPGGDFAFGTADFTIECWCYSKNRGTYDYIIEGRNSGQTTGTWTLVYGYSGANPSTLEFATGSTTLLTCPTASNPEAGRWFHVAVARSGTSLKMFIDGVEVTSATNSTDFSTSPSTSYIGTRYSQQHYWDGYMQDIRVYKGVAKYTSDFVVPSRSPDILPDTPSGVAGGSKLTKITDGAVTFHGADHLTVADGSNDFSFGTGAYTVEGYLYPTTLTGNGDANPRFFCCGTPSASSNRNQLQIVLAASGAIRLDTNGTNYNSTAGDVVVNKWQHVAVARDGSGNLKAFVDGRQVISQTSVNNDITNNDGISLGIEAGFSSRFTGFMSNVRILKGTALYTSNFIPPTAPLTNVTNTKLLCCQSNSEGPQKTAVIPTVTGTATAMWPLNSDINDDSGNSNNLSETGGSTSFTSAASNSFGITNAANFAKDGKYLSYAVTPASAWTIDGYIRLETTTTSAPYILGWNGTDGSDTCLGFPSDGSRKFTVFGSSNLNTDVVAEIGRWYHVRITTNSTSDLALYVDGVLAGRSTSSDGGPASPITIGDVQSGRFSGQIAGVRYTPTDLGAPPLGGETTSSGVTSNSPSVGVSLAGDVAATNFNPFNTDINTVRGQETVYATLNPLVPHSGTFSDGNLSFAGGSAAWCKSVGNFQIPSSGKYYFEGKITGSGTAAHGIGLAEDSKNNVAGSTESDLTTGDDYYCVVNNTSTTVNKVSNGSATSLGSMGAFSAGDLFGVAVDGSTKEIWVHKNGIYLGGNTPTGTALLTGSGNLFPAIWGYNTTGSWDVNFGQKPFSFTPPDGFQPLNTANTRPTTVISRPDQYVGVAAYTSGNGSAVSVSSYNFSPELLWFKDLDGNNNWAIFDQVRGNGLRLDCSGAGKEQDWSAYFSSFDDNGFTVTDQTSDINRSTNQICSWGWKAGGNPGISTTAFWKDDQEYASAAAAGMNGGSITPIGASVGTKQGFSIITYRANLTQGATISHGLTQKPDFAIFKNRDSTLGNNEVDWGVYHTVVGATKRLELNQNAAEEAFPGPFNDTEPTSSVFTFGGQPGAFGHSYLTNGPSGDRFVGYIWHNVPGLQKFGSYEGNGNDNGPFVELGFRPAVLILKCIDNSGDDYDWRLIDSTREPFNDGSGSKYVVPNKTDSQADNSPIDFLSNGFKIRKDTNEINLNAHTFVYAAWAEAPSVDLYGGGANAR